MITLNENMTLRFEVDTISNLLARVNFKNKVFCDKKTLNILIQNAAPLENVKVVAVLHTTICNALYDNIMAYSNTSTPVAFFRVVKRYLSGDNKKSGALSVEERKRSIITELLDNTKFINDFNGL